MRHLANNAEKVQRIIVNVALAVTSFLIPLALAESLLRLHSGPPPRLPPPTPYRRLTPRGPRLIPGAEVDFLFESTVQPVRVAINSHGLRGPGLRRNPHSARILFLGDSVAFGYGVSQESTFVALLGKEWDRRSLAWEAVNGGVEDAGIVEERTGRKRDQVFVAMGIVRLMDKASGRNA